MVTQLSETVYIKKSKLPRVNKIIQQIFEIINRFYKIFNINKEVDNKLYIVIDKTININKKQNAKADIKPNTIINMAINIDYYNNTEARKLPNIEANKNFNTDKKK